MKARQEFLSRRLESSRAKTVVFFQQITAGQWSTEIYSEGACWTIREILAHNVAAEDSILRLVLGIVDGGEGVREDFNLDAYNEHKVAQMKDLTPDELLAEFDRVRRVTIKAVSQFDEGDFDKQGRHPWLGVTRVEEIIKLMFRHNQIHIREIRSALVMRTPKT